MKEMMMRKSIKLLPATLLLLVLLTPATAQEEYKKYKDEHAARKLDAISNMENSRSKGRLQNSFEGEGRQKYRKIVLMDGNLVTGPVVNSGLISYSGIGSDLRIGWPKGTQRSDYIWGAYFYVAGEVNEEEVDGEGNIFETGNLLHIVSDNFRFGEVSPDGTHEYATRPQPKYFNLDIPNASDVPLVYGISEDVGIDGIPRSNDEGEGDGILQPQEDINLNGILDLRLKNEVNWFALTNRKETWPEYWPVGSYPGDDRSEGEERPGVRAGRWNGEFGALNRADQEAYYIMDDYENDEFNYYPFNETQPWPKGRYGLGFQTESRTYQWNARLAEDLLIAIYDITNKSPKGVEKAVVGMYVDPDMGGSFTNDDASFDEIDDITYSWNKLFIAQNGLPLGYFGFAFLESPGLSEDGIDNDFDGLVDESQTNGIDDDGDWVPWEDTNGNGVHDNEDLNYNAILDPGEDINENGLLDIEPLHDDLGSDGIGPDFFEYTGPDNNGSEANGIPDDGEPNFEFTDNDESDQVGLTSWYLRSTREDPGMEGDEHFWNNEIPPGTFQIVEGYEVDISFTYGSGYVRFAGNELTHRYAIALVFGNDFDDILRNKRTMQVIYDNDYNFSKPPLQPRLTAVADDDTVYLSWDDIAERSRDPIYGNDFEAYYVYRATEPSFNEIRTITDAYGNPFLFEPRAIFDKADGLKGLHPVSIGSELGPESDLGVTYNMGTDSGVKHRYVDTDVTNGRTYYYAVASIDQGYHPDFYPEISPLRDLQPTSPVESAVNIATDPLGRPIAFDPNTVAVVPSERSAGWSEPTLSEEGLLHTSGIGTGDIEIRIYSPLEVRTGHRYRIDFDDDGEFDSLAQLLYAGPAYTGRLNKMQIESVTEDFSIASIDNPKNNDLSEQFIFDGLQVILHNDSNLVDSIASVWTSGSVDLRVRNEEDAGIPTGIPVGRDYEIRVGEVGFDSTFLNQPKNFQVWDITDADNEIKLDYTMLDIAPVSMLSAGDKITLIGSRPNDKVWVLEFYVPSGASGNTLPEPGNEMLVRTSKSFDRNDSFEFTVIGNEFNAEEATDHLNDIYTVPDPYVALNTLERQVVNEDEGRGDRQIDFVNLPQQCTITIFTASGKIVRTIEFSSFETDKQSRRASWDLRTKDGLEVAHGMYFYHVDAPGIGEKTGKFGVIK